MYTGTPCSTVVGGFAPPRYVRHRNVLTMGIYNRILLDKVFVVLCLAGQSPVVEQHWSEAGLNGVGESPSDAIEGEPRENITQELAEREGGGEEERKMTEGGSQRDGGGGRERWRDIQKGVEKKREGCRTQHNCRV